jgi:hypothetical protein
MLMIPFKKFQKFNPDLKAFILWKDGVNLSLMRSEEDFLVCLYELYGYYVELFFDADSEPVSMKEFEDVEKLSPYLSSLDIEEVVVKLN